MTPALIFSPECSNADMKILLSGIGGDIAESIADILSTNIPGVQIVGIDSDLLKINVNLFDEYYECPPAKNVDYCNWLKDFLENRRFDFFIPTSEEELNKLASLNKVDMDYLESLVQIVWVGKEVTRMFLSKISTNQFLAELNLEPPKMYELNSTIDPIKFPIVVKPDKGRGSKNLFICNNDNELEAALVFVSDPIIQEYVADIENEYTCCVFRNLTGDIFVLILRRYLSGGLTCWVELVNDPQIEKTCKLIADKINLSGSINIQLRKKGERVAVFEINPRFSSTVLFRSVFGFNDVLWSLGIHDPNSNYVSLTTSGLTAKIRRKVEVFGL